jgi:Domain of unknown function (DUF427)
MGAQTPVNSRGKPGIAEHHLGTRTRTFAGDIRREREPCALLAMQKVVGSNPISRLKKAAICRSISTRQPASASASPCTQCAPARLDVPVGAEKEGICRSLADARTTDLLHRGGSKVIDIRRTSRELSVRSGDEAVAESHRPLVLYESGFAPRWYVLREDIDEAALAPVSPQTSAPTRACAPTTTSATQIAPRGRTWRPTTRSGRSTRWSRSSQTR